ncbi:hypothetical protein QC758_19130, partial [Halomonas campisalis]
TMVVGEVSTDGFSFTGGTGVNTLWLSEVVGASSPELGTEAVWTIDLSNAAADSVVRITDDVDFSGGPDSALNVDLGGDAELLLDGDFDFGGDDEVGSISVSGGQMTLTGHVDFRGLQDGTDTNLDLDGVTIFLEAGATVQMTDEQYEAFVAAGGTIEGPGTTLLLDDFVDNTILDSDLTDVRGLTELQIVRNSEDGTTDPASSLLMTGAQAQLEDGTYLVDIDEDGNVARTLVDPDTGLANSDGEPVENGDFRAFSSRITILVSDDRDLTDLQLKTDTGPEDRIVIGHESAPELRITEDQAEILRAETEDLVGGPWDFGNWSSDEDDILAAVSELKVGIEFVFDDPVTGEPIDPPETADITFTTTVDNGDVSVAVSGLAAAMGVAQQGDAVADLMEADSVETVEFTSVGSRASLENEPGAGFDAYGDDASSTFVFASLTVSIADNEDDFTSITNFQAGDGGVDSDPFDILDFSAFFEADDFDTVASGTTAEADPAGLIVLFSGTSTLTAGNFGDGDNAEFDENFDGEAIIVAQDGPTANAYHVTGDGAGSIDIVQIAELTGVTGAFVEENFA